MSVSNQPNMFGMLWILKVVDFLPKRSTIVRLGYEKQCKTLDLFRLLLLEMLHRRVEIEKQDYRKYSSSEGHD